MYTILTKSTANNTPTPIRIGYITPPPPKAPFEPSPLELGLPPLTLQLGAEPSQLTCAPREIPITVIPPQLHASAAVNVTTLNPEQSVDRYNPAVHDDSADNSSHEKSMDTSLPPAVVPKQPPSSRFTVLFPINEESSHVAVEYTAPHTGVPLAAGNVGLAECGGVTVGE
eukprot:CAMPEP_0114418598 /NCGR_PEP_ID=MMETSP0103-20121206/3582_1 /TAXON_ID=37642 ORGANISM="Paraphysomonas imperforata, Strain PA2" /NCGR_SAMPLE_ID=MMETSP0103 /ASSEMBLY_ACC=CAM_ASM_000201 /LENGTH=169 /DNA_ID=CAMNT_0001586967 /DNA_START=146 /DNA_END=655 /DNA_ORIENTATION=+